MRYICEPELSKKTLYFFVLSGNISHVFKISWEIFPKMWEIQKKKSVVYPKTTDFLEIRR